MNEDNIEKLFEGIQSNLDIEMPNSGHEQRFLNKLNSNKSQTKRKKPRIIFSKSFMAIAATIVLCFGLFFFLKNKPEVNDLASVSKELSQTQDFFTTAISSELNKIKDLRNPENEVLVSDALKQMELLEKNYERLKIDLKESGNDRRVIYAMISNFQNRIDILENVLKTIEDLKNRIQSEQNRMTL